MLWLTTAGLLLSGCSTVPLSTHNNTYQSHGIPQALPNQYTTPNASHQHSPVRTLPVAYQRPATLSTQRTTSRSRSHTTPQRHALLSAAHRSLGVPYRYGGTSPKSGFDCSGFTQHSYQSINVKIPRTAAQQSAASRTIRRQDLRPGDMIFFKTSGTKVNHVGIYVGNGKFIHAASGGGRVTTDDLRKSYWQKRLHKYGRVLS